jgi:hypothetical protein
VLAVNGPDAADGVTPLRDYQFAHPARNPYHSSRETHPPIRPVRLYLARRKHTPGRPPAHDPQSLAINPTANDKGRTMNRNDLNHRLPDIVQIAGRQRDGRAADEAPRPRLPPQPRRDHQGIDLLRQLIFPGYFGKQGITTDNLAYRLGELSLELTDILYDQVRCCLRYREGITGENGDADRPLRRVRRPRPRRSSPTSSTASPPCASCSPTDVQAAFDGDPAAKSHRRDDLLLPGLFAIFVQRFAHEFYKLGVPLLPRIMTEHAHSRPASTSTPAPSSARASSSTTAPAS